MLSARIDPPHRPDFPESGEGRSGARHFGDLGHGRSNNFDALRLVLATLVISSHSYPLLQGSNGLEPVMRGTHGQASGGELAVNAFFILSGFLVTRSWLEGRDLRTYLRKRVLRIYPGYLVAVAFCALVVAPLGTARPLEFWGRVEPARFVLSTLNLRPVLPPVFPDLPFPTLNGSLWTIRFEFSCYLATAALGLGGALRRRSLAAAAFIASLAVYSVQAGFGLAIGTAVSADWPRLLSCYLSGTVFYLYRGQIPRSAPLAWAAVAGLAVLAKIPEPRALMPATVVLGAYLLFSLASLKTPRLHDLARRGDYSYGLYLYGFPVQQLLIRWFPGRLTPSMLSLVAYPIVGVLAVASWHLVERPWLRREGRGHRVPSRRAPLKAGVVQET